MKKISFRVRNFEKEQFLTFDIDNDAELDEELLDFIEDEEPKGVVPVIFEEGEDFDTFSYNITDKIHVCELSNQEITAEMVLKVVRGLVLALMDMSEYRIPLSYLVLNRNYIYVNSEYQIEFICIPLEDMQGETDINSFLRNFLASLRYEPSENDSYVARLLTYVNHHAMFNLRNMLTLVEELMEELGIEIPEDVSTEIYADYEEVLAAAEEAEAEEPEEADIEIRTVEEPEAVEEETGITKEPVGVKEETEIPEEPVEAEEETEIPEEPVEVEEETEIEEEPVEAEEETEIEEELVMTEEEAEAVDISDSEEAVILSEETDTSQEIVNKLKEKLARNKKNAESAEESTLEDNGNPDGGKKDKGAKKPAFKTKDTSITGVVIQDELDEFLAEKEMEEKTVHHEESGLKIKKNIKVNRASIVKNTQEELKAAEEASAGEETETAAAEAEESDDTPQAAADSVTASKGAAVPKVNPYLIRVNTGERVMITKQTFKIGKASMGIDYTVKGNGAVSRVHAIITNKDGEYYIKDNKSTNHTYVNGKNIEDGENELLTHDSKIVLGDEEFTFKMS